MWWWLHHSRHKCLPSTPAGFCFLINTFGDWDYDADKLEAQSWRGKICTAILSVCLPRGPIEYVPYNWDNHKWKRKCICWLNGWILLYVRILDYSSFNSDTSVLPTTERVYINTTFHRDPLLSAPSACIYYFLSVCAFRSKNQGPRLCRCSVKLCGIQRFPLTHRSTWPRLTVRKLSAVSLLQRVACVHPGCCAPFLGAAD